MVFDQGPKPPGTSSLLNHLNFTCREIPPGQKWEAAVARSTTQAPKLNPSQQSLGAMFQTSTPVPKPPPTAISKSIFCSALIQGVIQDNFPLTFGEGEGMKLVFLLVNPTLSLPSHQTMRLDLDKLYVILLIRVKTLMMVCLSKLHLFLK